MVGGRKFRSKPFGLRMGSAALVFVFACVWDLQRQQIGGSLDCVDLDWCAAGVLYAAERIREAKILF